MEILKVGEDSLGSPDRRPCFYRIMLFQNLTELVTISYRKQVYNFVTIV